jgi:hypothetical protein
MRIYITFKTKSKNWLMLDRIQPPMSNMIMTMLNGVNGDMFSYSYAQLLPATSLILYRLNELRIWHREHQPCPDRVLAPCLLP